MVAFQMLNSVATFNALFLLSKYLKTSSLSFDKHEAYFRLVVIYMPLKTLQAIKLRKTALAFTKNCAILTGVVNNNYAYF